MVDMHTTKVLTLRENNVTLSIKTCDNVATDFIIMKCGNTSHFGPSEFEYLKILIEEYETKYKEVSE